MKFKILFIALLVSVFSFGQTAIYTITSTTAATQTGTKPTGSSHAYSQTYATAKQLTSGNSATLTLSGYAGYRITSIVLNMASNASAGAGNLSVVAGSTSIYSIPTNTFANAAWNGAYTTTYTNVTKTPSAYDIATGENVVISIAATTNSLYIQSYSITYESATPPPTLTVSPTTLTGFNYIIGNGPSAEQSFTAAGTNLTANLVVAAPTNYEVSTTSGSGFGTSVTLTPSSGTVSSNIITNTGFAYTSNHDYTVYQATPITSAVNSVGVFKFTIQDGGGTADTDLLGTELTSITFNVTNSANLRNAALFGGATQTTQLNNTPVINTVAGTIHLRD